jgi:Arc-like DNA binding domain
MTMHPDDRQQPARLNLRLDDKLRSRIEAAAQASRRSMNAEICHRIEQAFIEQRPEETRGDSRPFHQFDKPAPGKENAGPH